MHRCAAKCCENDDLSVDRVHQCVENCSVHLSSAQNYVHKEFEHFQVSGILSLFTFKILKYLLILKSLIFSKTFLSINVWCTVEFPGWNSA